MSKSEISKFRENGSWKSLEKVAVAMVAEAEQRAGSEMKPLLGGGTRLMLSYEHRVSNDIDLFIRDPQWLSFLTPRLHDDFGRFPVYEEASNFLKIKQAKGEIDFIVGMSLLGLPSETSPDTSFALEPVAEVLAKKLFYRGATLTARDLFDWWAVSTATPEVFPATKMVELLGPKLSGVQSSLNQLAASKAALVIWDALVTKEKPEFSAVLKWARCQISEGTGVKCRPTGPSMG